MELHQLQYALKVHQKGSFTAAANALHISQSGVSAQVAKLERELGITLFDRTARTTKLTDAGTELLPLMAAALRDIDRISDVAGELLGLVRGSVRMGTIVGCTIPEYLDGFSEFRATYPGITVTTTETGSDELLSGLISAELDIALLAHCEPLPRNFDAFTIIEEPLAAGVPAEHPWARNATLDIRELATADIITLAAGTGIRSAVQTACAKAGITLTPVVEAHSPETVLALAERNAGVAVLSESMIPAPLIAVTLTGTERASLSVAMTEYPSAASRAFAKILSRKFLGTS